MISTREMLLQTRFIASLSRAHSSESNGLSSHPASTYLKGKEIGTSCEYELFKRSYTKPFGQHSQMLKWLPCIFTNAIAPPLGSVAKACAHRTGNKQPIRYLLEPSDDSHRGRIEESA